MKRFIVAALGVGAWLKWMRHRRANRPKRAETSDAEIAAEVRAVVDEIAASYIESGAVTVEEDADTPPDLALTVKPQNPNAASVSVWVFDEVGVAVGGGNLELWPDSEGVWRRDLEDILAAIAEGRYREEVTEGWVFERKVLMQFEGTPYDSCQYACLAYEDEKPPPVGTFSYEPW